MHLAATFFLFLHLRKVWRVVCQLKSITERQRCPVPVVPSAESRLRWGYLGRICCFSVRLPFEFKVR